MHNSYGNNFNCAVVHLCLWGFLLYIWRNKMRSQFCSWVSFQSNKTDINFGNDSQKLFWLHRKFTSVTKQPYLLSTKGS